jgi:YgiT-type zinc finger domain-containing protein
MNDTDEPKNLCDFCGGELRPGTTEMEVRINGELVVIEDLSALICHQCGEAYFTAQVSRQIDDILARRKELKPLRYESVPVFSPELVG